MPIPFHAMHLNIPDRLLLIADMTLTLSFTRTSPELIQATSGGGLPVALQYSVTLSPSETWLGQFCMADFGGTVKILIIK